MASSLIISSNYLCAQDVNTVACPSLILGPQPPDTPSPHLTRRVPCSPLPWTCAGAQPARDAPCISPGRWLVLESLSVTPQTPLIVRSNITIQGNLTVPVGSTLTVQLGKVITVQGCVDISGSIAVDVAGQPALQTGDSRTIVEFAGSNSSACSTTTGATVTVVGSSAPCKKVSGSTILSTTGLSVVFDVADDAGCKSVPGDRSSSSNLPAIAGGIAAAAVVVVVIVVILLYRFRHRVIPAMRLSTGLRKFRESRTSTM
jgi:hypothetical protein